MTTKRRTREDVAKLRDLILPLWEQGHSDTAICEKLKAKLPQLAPGTVRYHVYRARLEGDPRAVLRQMHPPREEDASVAEKREQVLELFGQGLKAAEIVRKVPGTNIGQVYSYTFAAGRAGDPRVTERRRNGATPAPLAAPEPTKPAAEALREKVLELWAEGLDTEAIVKRLPALSAGSVALMVHKARKDGDTRAELHTRTVSRNFEMARRGELGYELNNRNVDGKMSTVARFRCQRCPAVYDIPVAGSRMIPEMLAKKAVRDGWRADSHKKHMTRCPSCLAGKTPAPIAPPPPLPTRPAEGPRIVTTASTLHPSSDPVADLFDAQEAAQAAPKPSPKPPAPAPEPAPKPPVAAAPAPAPAPKAEPLTTQQRLVIRNLLDAHFDDSTGAFLDGYSDQRIAEEAGVQVAQVVRMRESAWGPLRAEPAALEAQVTALARRLAELEGVVRGMFPVDQASKGGHVNGRANH